MKAFSVVPSAAEFQQLLAGPLKKGIGVSPMITQILSYKFSEEFVVACSSGQVIIEIEMNEAEVMHPPLTHKSPHQSSRSRVVCVVFCKDKTRQRPEGEISWEAMVNECRSTFSGKDVFQLFRESVKESGEDLHVELALLSLLESEAENPYIGGFDFNQESAGEVFHLQFRQFGVCKHAAMDKTIWHLLHCSSLFWKVLEKKAVLSYFPDLA